MAERIAGDHRDVQLLRHDRNEGHIRTYNDGLKAVTGDYVVLLSADDLLPPGALGRAVALLEAHPRVGFVYGYARSFTDVAPAQMEDVRNWSVWSGRRWLARTCRLGRCLIVSPEVVMRRTALEEAGYYDERLPHSADFYLWMRAAFDWDVGRINGSTQALYRVHEQNMHLTTYAGWTRDLEERRRTFELFFDDGTIGHPDVGSLRPRAMRALARESLRRALTAFRDGADPEQVQAHLDFAARTDPDVRSSLLWKACQVGPAADRTLPLPSLRRKLSVVRHHARWRYERRYGL